MSKRQGGPTPRTVKRPINVTIPCNGSHRLSSNSTRLCDVKERDLAVSEEKNSCRVLAVSFNGLQEHKHGAGIVCCWGSRLWFHFHLYILPRCSITNLYCCLDFLKTICWITHPPPSRFLPERTVKDTREGSLGCSVELSKWNWKICKFSQRIVRQIIILKIKKFSYS